MPETSEPALGSVSANAQRIGSPREGAPPPRGPSPAPAGQNSPAARAAAARAAPRWCFPPWGRGYNLGQRAEDVRDNRRGDPGAAPAELLADQRALHRAEAGAAELLGHVRVHQADLVRLRDHVGGGRLVLVVLGGLRADLLLRELVRELTQRALLLREREGDSCSGCRYGRHLV